MIETDYKKSFEDNYDNFKVKKPYYKLIRKKYKSKKMIELIDNIEKINKEFHNFVKWNEKQREIINQEVKKELITKMLPCLDSFENALKYENSDFGEFKKGSKLINKQLSEVIGG